MESDCFPASAKNRMPERQDSASCNQAPPRCTRCPSRAPSGAKSAHHSLTLPYRSKKPSGFPSLVPTGRVRAPALPACQPKLSKSRSCSPKCQRVEAPQRAMHSHSYSVGRRYTPPSSNCAVNLEQNWVASCHETRSTGRSIASNPSANRDGFSPITATHSDCVTRRAEQEKASTEMERGSVSRRWRERDAEP